MRTRALLTSFALLAAAAAPVPALADVYEIDTAHSTVSFQVRHLGISKVRGWFSGFAGTLDFDPANMAATKIQGTIQTASIDTRNEKRDDHLRGEDFFWAEKHPEISFESTSVEPTGETTAKVTGNLTMRGVTKPVILDAEYLGAIVDPWGNHKAGFSASTTINRKDWGIVWNKILDTGGLTVGDEVTIELEIEAQRQ